MSYPVWSDSQGRVEVRFVGRGPERTRDETLAAVEPSAPPVAALKQVHSARVVSVDGAGHAGEGDALVTTRASIALSVITADCVPVLIAMGDAVAAVHAGWRGVVGGVVPAALSRLRETAAAAGVNDMAPVAWIGPSIGACCYEVGPEVAAPVVAASGEEVSHPGPAGKPHLDVARAVELQLRREGIEDVRRFGPCTRCHPELLWSYRREGAKAGRNIAYVWRVAGD
ncbi:MAG TPA: polyphenol oxidase family protein [Thermoanaerobaculia bacterium]|nr:polyphenol oxidase family protein [Thermoanaerobaculia bacterium]